jgi:hypothetical protein
MTDEAEIVAGGGWRKSGVMRVQPLADRAFADALFYSELGFFVGLGVAWQWHAAWPYLLAAWLVASIALFVRARRLRTTNPGFESNTAASRGGHDEAPDPPPFPRPPSI